VVQITGHEPLSQEAMRTVTLQAARNLTGRDLLEQLRNEKAVNPFAFETLKGEMVFVDLDQPVAAPQEPKPASEEAPAKGG
jgi:hypothetical protein